MVIHARSSSDWKDKRYRKRMRNLAFKELKKRRVGGPHNSKNKYTRPPKLNVKDIDNEII